MCGPEHGSLGDLATDTGSGWESGSGDGSSQGSGSTEGSSGTETGTTPGCGPIQLTNVAQGIGGFAVDSEAGNANFGGASGAGDVDGDGLADVILGAREADANGTESGRTHVVFGKTSTDKVLLADVVQGIGGFAVDGESAEDHSGDSVSAAGDVNGDGLGDVVVGAPDANPNGFYSGRAYVVLGKTSTDKVLLADVAQGIGGFAVDGDVEYDEAGYAVSGAGDVNGDGLADVLVGARGAGRSYVVFGKADTDAVSLADVGQGSGGFALNGGGGNASGRSVSAAGDVNGDGLADVIVGEPGALEHDNDGHGTGRSYVVFGKADTSSVSLADVVLGAGGFAMDGEAAGDESGLSVSGAGDANGDGLADVLVGAPESGPNGDGSGRTYVVFGKTSTDKVLLADVAGGIGGFVLDGEAEEDHSGGAVSQVGDLNGDGLADMVVGAPDADPNGVDGVGRTYVVFGKADTDPVLLADVVLGVGGFALDGDPAALAWSGSSVSGGGDVNGDGTPDVIVGANGAYRAYVLFGGDFSCGGG